MRLRSRTSVPLAIAASALLGAAGLVANAHTAAPVTLAATTIPTYDHVVVVMEENHSYADIIGNTQSAPYLNSLASQGALMTAPCGHPPERAELPGAVRRQHVRPVQRRLPGQ